MRTKSTPSEGDGLGKGMEVWRRREVGEARRLADQTIGNISWVCSDGVQRQASF